MSKRTWLLRTLVGSALALYALWAVTVFVPLKLHFECDLGPECERGAVWLIALIPTLALYFGCVLWLAIVCVAKVTGAVPDSGDLRVLRLRDWTAIGIGLSPLVVFAALMSGP